MIVEDFLGREIKVGSRIIYAPRSKKVELRYGNVQKISFVKSKNYWEKVDVRIYVEVQKPEKMYRQLVVLRSENFYEMSDEKAIFKSVFVAS